MKNIWIRLAAILFCLCIFCGCVGSTQSTETHAAAAPTSDISPGETAVPPSVPTFAEQLVGRYLYDSAENGETVLELYLFDGMLLAEVTQEYAAYYAAELTPVSPAALSGTDRTQAGFTAFPFSGFSDSGAFWEECPQVTVTLCAEGICLTEADGTAVTFLRDETREPTHIADRCAALLPQPSGQPYPDGITGTWTAVTEDGSSILLRLNTDGSLLWYCKQETVPVTVYIGVGSVTEDASGCILTLAAERVGYAQMPWLYCLTLVPTDDGLRIANHDGDGLLPDAEPLLLTKH